MGRLCISGSFWPLATFDADFYDILHYKFYCFENFTQKGLDNFFTPQIYSKQNLCAECKLCAAVQRLETVYEVLPEKFCWLTSGEIDMAALKT